MKRRLIAALALVVPMVALSATAASAHTALVNTDPRDGAILSAPPAVIMMTFNEDLMPGAVATTAVDSSGTQITLPEATLDGPVAMVDWPADQTSGQYTVKYRVVSDDGHPVTGEFAFIIEGDETPSPSPSSSSPTASPSSSSATPTSSSASPPAPEPTSSSPTPTQSTSAPAPSSSSAAPVPSPTSEGTAMWIWLGALVVGIVVAAGIAVAITRKRGASS